MSEELISLRKRLVLIGLGTVIICVMVEVAIERREKQAASTNSAALSTNVAVNTNLSLTNFPVFTNLSSATSRLAGVQLGLDLMQQRLAGETNSEVRRVIQDLMRGLERQARTN